MGIIRIKTVALEWDDSHADGFIVMKLCKKIVKIYLGTNSLLGNAVTATRHVNYRITRRTFTVVTVLRTVVLATTQFFLTFVCTNRNRLEAIFSRVTRQKFDRNFSARTSVCHLKFLLVFCIYSVVDVWDYVREGMACSRRGDRRLDTCDFRMTVFCHISLYKWKNLQICLIFLVRIFWFQSVFRNNIFAVRERHKWSRGRRDRAFYIGAFRTITSIWRHHVSKMMKTSLFDMSLFFQ